MPGRRGKEYRCVSKDFSRKVPCRVDRSGTLSWTCEYEYHALPGSETPQGSVGRSEASLSTLPQDSRIIRSLFGQGHEAQENGRLTCIISQNILLNGNLKPFFPDSIVAQTLWSRNSPGSAAVSPWRDMDGLNPSVMKKGKEPAAPQIPG